MQSQNVGNLSFDDFISGAAPAAPAKEETITPTTDQLVPKQGEAVDGDEKLKEFLGKSAETKEPVTQFFKDIPDLYSKLKEKKLAYDFQDGTVETEEDLYNALQSSVEHNAQSKVDDLWQAKVESLPPSLLKIHQYASTGVTTAEELSRFMSSVTQQEVIAKLDPKSPDDQSQIVLLHLMNTGLNEKDARAEIADLVEMKKLENSAQRFFPALKKSYDDSVKTQLLEKQQAEEEEQRFFDTNKVNVEYFLDEKNQDYLPFKLTSNTQKNNVWKMAAQVVGLNDRGEAIYGWEDYIKNLQFGDEKSYKMYMKLMAFASDMESYDKEVAKGASNTTNQKNFQKIIATSPSTTNHNQGEQKVEPTSPQAKQNNAAWGVR